MFQRLSSLILITFLTVLVGVKDSALGFCLCDQALFLGKDPCVENATECSSGQDCCAEEEPCDDCVLPVQLEVEDYLWTSENYHFQAPLTAATQAVFTTTFLRNLPASSTQSAPIEPPPPLRRHLLIQRQRLLL